MKQLFCLGLLLFLSSCYTRIEQDPENVNGMRPVYSQDLDIELREAAPVLRQGKIVYAHPYLLVNEKFKGIHIYDNTDPTDPQLIRFLNIPGNIDFSVNGNIIYANSFRDLVTLQLTGFESVNETHRIKDHYEQQSLVANLYPEDYFGYFECVDPEKGNVVGWNLELLNNPKCFR